MSGIDRMLDAVEWRPLIGPVEPGELYATHEGVLQIGGLSFRCYTLNDGRRLLDADDVARFLGGGPDAATE